MNLNRNEFLENLHFDIAPAIEEYSNYLTEYKKLFYTQAHDVHQAIQKAFPTMDFHTICRIKSFDSTLDKIKRRTKEKVFDIHGMKHIIHSVDGDTSEPVLMAYCYKMKSFLENYYSNLGIEISRIKDYIASPKESGYEALHLSGKVLNENSRKFETQIKTVKMEEIAKHGSANHAEKYKPRQLGNYPIAKVPHYLTIFTSDDGQILSHELSLSERFQYFYNIPYETYLENIKNENQIK